MAEIDPCDNETSAAQNCCRATEPLTPFRWPLIPAVIARLQAAVDRMSQSRRLRRYLGRLYLRVNIWVWNHLPTSLTSSRLGWMYGAHLHELVQLRSERKQYMGTFFFRNRPELQLLIRLLDSKRQASAVNLTILGCSKGAEVYSFSYSIRSTRPDLNLPPGGPETAASTGPVFPVSTSSGDIA